MVQLKFRKSSDNFLNDSGIAQLFEDIGLKISQLSQFRSSEALFLFRSNPVCYPAGHSALGFLDQVPPDSLPETLQLRPRTTIFCGGIL